MTSARETGGDSPLYFWHRTQASEALLALTSHCVLGQRSHQLATPTYSAALDLGSCLEQSAASVGVEVEPATVRHHDLEGLFPRVAPAIVFIPGRGLLLLAAGGRRRVVVLGTDLRRYHVSIRWLKQLLAALPTCRHNWDVHQTGAFLSGNVAALFQGTKVRAVFASSLNNL